MVGHWAVTVEAWVQFQPCPRGISVGQSDPETGFSPGTCFQQSLSLNKCSLFIYLFIYHKCYIILATDSTVKA